VAQPDHRLLTAGDWVVVDTRMYDDYSFGIGRIAQTDRWDDESVAEVLYADHRLGWGARWHYLYELEPYEPTDEEVMQWMIEYLSRT
jgi:hypothetical protein